MTPEQREMCGRFGYLLDGLQLPTDDRPADLSQRDQWDYAWTLAGQVRDALAGAHGEDARRWVRLAKATDALIYEVVAEGHWPAVLVEFREARTAVSRLPEPLNCSEHSPKFAEMPATDPEFAELVAAQEAAFAEQEAALMATAPDVAPWVDDR
jgi:hypothetical protein